jgi:hypothetical protein
MSSFAVVIRSLSQHASAFPISQAWVIAALLDMGARTDIDRKGKGRDVAGPSSGDKLIPENLIPAFDREPSLLRLLRMAEIAAEQAWTTTDGHLEPLLRLALAMALDPESASLHSTLERTMNVLLHMEGADTADEVRSKRHLCPQAEQRHRFKLSSCPPCQPARERTAGISSLLLICCRMRRLRISCCAAGWPGPC